MFEVIFNGNQTQKIDFWKCTAHLETLRNPALFNEGHFIIDFEICSNDNVAAFFDAAELGTIPTVNYSNLPDFYSLAKEFKYSEFETYILNWIKSNGISDSDVTNILKSSNYLHQNFVDKIIAMKIDWILQNDRDILDTFSSHALCRIFSKSTITHIDLLCSYLINRYDKSVAESRIIEPEFYSLFIFIDCSQLPEDQIHKLNEITKNKGIYVPNLSSRTNDFLEQNHAQALSVKDNAIDDLKKQIAKLKEQIAEKNDQVIFLNDIASNKIDKLLHGSELTQITLPSSKMSLNGRTFTRCSKLCHITCHGRNYAELISHEGILFYDDYFNLICYPSRHPNEIFHIPRKTMSINEYAFKYCSNLRSITVDQENNKFASQDGVLFSRDMTELIRLPCNHPNQTYTIPDTVTSIRPFALSGCINLLSVTIPSSVRNIHQSTFQNSTNLTTVVLPDGLFSIAPRTFKNCTHLTSITLPNSIISIGKSAFKNCSSLRSLLIPNGVKEIGQSAFENCYHLESIIIPNTLEAFQQSAFKNCYNLTSITIPSNVNLISTSAFENCSKLTSLVIPNTVTAIGCSAFNSCTGLTSVTCPLLSAKIIYIAFGNCTKIQSLTLTKCNSSFQNIDFPDFPNLESINIEGNNEHFSLVDGILFSRGMTTLIHYPSKHPNQTYVIPDTVTEIGDRAFSYCTNLRSIEIGQNVDTIGFHAFSYCSNLESITIPERVMHGSSNAFVYCTNLRTINLGHIASRGHSFPFIGCPNLTEIIVDENNPAYKSIDGILFSKDMQTLIHYPSNKPNEIYQIPNGVTTIDRYAFDSCSQLTSIILPSGVTTIQISAFRDCTNLVSIDIPDTIETIGYSAFENCVNLSSINIPSNVTQIDSKTFANCSQLTSIMIPKDVQFISPDAFSGSNLTSITVDQNNEYFISIDDILYTKDMKSLILYPSNRPGDTYHISSTIEEIENYSLSNLRNVKTITIPALVDNLRQIAEGNCPKLESFIVSDTNISLTSLDGILFDKNMETLIRFPCNHPSQSYTVPSELKLSRVNIYNKLKY